MDVFLVVLAAVLSGTAVGVGTVWMLSQQQRKGHKPTTGVAVLKEQLQNTESALAAAVVGTEALKKQIAQRDLHVQKLEEELKARQNQSEQSVQDVRREAELRAAAAQRAAELEQQLQKLTEEHATLEGRVNEQTGTAMAQANEQLAAMQAELESERKLVQELAAESSRMKAEFTELQTLAESGHSQRSALETQIEQEREQVRQLVERVSGLEAERAQLDAQLQEERQSAAQGREMLAMAQEKLDKLAMVFKAVAGDVPGAAEPANGSTNGNGASANGHTPAEAVTVALEIPPAAEEEAAEIQATVA